MRVNPAIRQEAEEEEPYALPFLPSIPAPIPRGWLHIPDWDALDALLSDGKPRVVMVVIGSHVLERHLIPTAFQKVIRKDAMGYTVWGYESHFDEWRREHFKNMEELATSPRSLIGMSLRRPLSELYYVPGAIPESLKINPSPSMILRRRRLTGHYGLVALARIFDNDRGKYAVWADDSNTLCDTASDWFKKFGYPARFDLKFYKTYALALNDYLARRELRHPVPLKGEG